MIEPEVVVDEGKDARCQKCRIRELNVRELLQVSGVYIVGTERK